MQWLRWQGSLHKKVAFSITTVVVVIIAGGAVYSALEEWTFSDGVWWAFITSLTIGYGDLSLTTAASRIFSIFFVLGMVTLMTVVMGNLSTTSYQLHIAQKRARLLKTKLTPAVLEDLDRDGEGVDRFEFVFGMLKLLDLVDDQDVDPWIKKVRRARC
uniref:Potassium channel domain-containing protein n=1 Tax=Phaeomonas parva TaxID=124430 RepID=A0A7S1XUM2_9STRA|mmetsp:Transcript_35686/g.112139  ORF Transcript_35686/g.112139 Transcript_35686/m.112139 type:complete len:158 (+) Transcript_35686:918-1391(+)